MKYLKKFLMLSAIGIILTGLIGLGILIYFGRELPAYHQLANYDPSVVTRIHAEDGQLFGEYAVQKRIFIPIKSIPKHIIQTFLVIEDKNFYQHFGIDIMGLIRAALKNTKEKIKGSSTVMGGSTITQQVAKNFLLSNEQTITRKIKEAILAMRIEHTFSKDKILELYLNEIYLGSGVYGIGAAAVHYFNKSLNELSIAEAAFLAALPKAPNNYHPERHSKAALMRRNAVIARMLEEGLITLQEALEAKEKPIGVIPRKQRETVEASYFVEEVRRFLLTTYGEKNLYHGGLSVRTTLNPRLQKIADAALKHGLIAYDRRHGWRGPLAHLQHKENWTQSLASIPYPLSAKPWLKAVVLSLEPRYVVIGLEDETQGHITFESMKWARRHFRNSKTYPLLGPVLKAPSDALSVGDVILVNKTSQKSKKDVPVYTLEQIPGIDGALIAIDPYTGRVLAMSGGYSYERSQYNRATQAYRQVGSAFKPFVYLAALENGYTPATPLLDAPFEMSMGAGQGIWRPRNIEKRTFGWAPLRNHLEHSRNLATIKLAHSLGMPKIIEAAKRFKVYDNMPPYLSAVIGSQETTLLRLTAAFAMFVNGGKELTPILIDRIQDRRGKTIFKSDTRTCEECQHDSFKKQYLNPDFIPELKDDRRSITDPITAYQIVSILEGAVKRGTGRSVKVEGYHIGGKTGSSNDFMDNWFVGFSPDLVVGVFVGFDAPKSTGEPGALTAAPIFQEFMKEALKGNPSQPFRIPPGAKFIQINAKTGEAAKPEDKDVLLEVFKPEDMFPDGSRKKPTASRAEMISVHSTEGIY